MQSIETTIVELGSIFQQLAHMVKEQEEMVQRYVVSLSSVQDDAVLHGQVISGSYFLRELS